MSSMVYLSTRDYRRLSNKPLLPLLLGEKEDPDAAHDRHAGENGYPGEWFFFSSGWDEYRLGACGRLRVPASSTSKASAFRSDGCAAATRRWFVHRWQPDIRLRRRSLRDLLLGVRRLLAHGAATTLRRRSRSRDDSSRRNRGHRLQSRTRQRNDVLAESHNQALRGQISDLNELR